MTCPKGLIKKSSKTNRLGDYMVEFDDPKGECIGCAMFKLSTVVFYKLA